MYISSRNTKQARELTEELLPVHNKLDIKLNATVCLSVIYITCKKPTDNLNGFGGLEVACWPLVAKFAGSNPAEAVGFLGRKKSSARLLSEGK